MTNQKRTIVTAIAGIVAIASILGAKDSISQQAVKLEPKALTEDYYLKPGMTPTNALSASNYQSTLPTGVVCGVVEEVPCHYIFTPTEEFPTFQDLLNSKNAISVVQDADEKREQ